MVDTVLECLRKHGQRLDLELAEETGLSLDDVHAGLDVHAKIGVVMICKVTRFERGRRIELLQYRVAGFFPRFTPGRKAK
jgi:hypothetical protein